MSQVKTKWITFGTSIILKRSHIEGVELRDDQISFLRGESGLHTIFKRNVNEDEWERLKDDYYEYKAEIDKFQDE